MSVCLYIVITKQQKASYSREEDKAELWGVALHSLHCDSQTEAASRHSLLRINEMQFSKIQLNMPPILADC